MSMAMRTLIRRVVPSRHVPTIREQLAINLRHALLRRGADETYADADDASWAAVDWTRLQRSMTVGGERVNVLDTGGDGPALLWVHGLSANWQSWLLNLPQFMGTYRCVALDLPGFGASDLPADEITITDYARTLDRRVRRARDPVGLRRRALDGRVHRDGARAAVPDARRAARARLRRRAVAGERAARAGARRGADAGHRRGARAPPTRTRWCAGRGCGGWRCRGSSATRSASRPR